MYIEQERMLIMYQLRHVLYITDLDVKLKAEGEHLKLIYNDGRKQTVPLQHIDLIISFSYFSPSAALMELCAKKQIGFVALNRAGRIRYQILGETKGNVLLRTQQYRFADDEKKSFAIAKKFIFSKINGNIQVLDRFIRNHPEKRESILPTRQKLVELSGSIKDSETKESLLGIEGISSKVYFSVFGEMILNKKEGFYFSERNRRPPRDSCNAMLSFAYSLIAEEFKHALECVGLDPYLGFLHTARPGKPSLAVDIMEEFRPLLADRFVLRLINLKMVDESDFETGEDNRVYLNEKGKQIFLKEWSRMHDKEIYIPDLGSSLKIGLIPHLRAQQFSHFIRDGDNYSPFEWR